MTRLEPVGPFTPGVTTERTFVGLEVRLRRTGWKRFFDATFLLMWLVCWAAGEIFALWMLGGGAWALITGQLSEAGRQTLVLAPTLAVGLFLIAWTALWTVGGVAALYHFLHVVWGEDWL